MSPRIGALFVLVGCGDVSQIPDPDVDIGSSCTPAIACRITARTSHDSDGDGIFDLVVSNETWFLGENGALVERVFVGEDGRRQDEVVTYRCEGDDLRSVRSDTYVVDDDGDAVVVETWDASGTVVWGQRSTLRRAAEGIAHAVEEWSEKYAELDNVWTMEQTWVATPERPRLIQSWNGGERVHLRERRWEVTAEALVVAEDALALTWTSADKLSGGTLTDLLTTHTTLWRVQEGSTLPNVAEQRNSPDGAAVELIGYDVDGECDATTAEGWFMPEWTRAAWAGRVR